MLARTVNFPAYKWNTQQSSICQCQPGAMLCLRFWWPAPPNWSGRTLLDWPRRREAFLWPFWRYLHRSTLGHSLLGHIYKFTWITHLAAASAAGFICPFVPLLPVMCILINTYLLINLGWVSGPSQFLNMFRTDVHFHMSEFVNLPLCSSVVAHGCEWGCGWWWGCLCTFSMGAPTAHWRMSCTSLLLRRMRYMGHHLHQGLWPKGRWKETLLKPIFSYYMLQGTFFQNLEESDWSRSQLEHYALQAGLKNSICMSIL